LRLQIIFNMDSQIKTNADFTKIFNHWKSELENYSEKDLEKQVSADSWTLGQVYNHLIGSTLYFHLKQVLICLNSSENKNKKKNFKGFLALNIIKGFPPIKIKVPASDLYTPKRPKTKQEIIEGLMQVEKQMNETVSLFDNNQNGKTTHPAFSFMNATEWYAIIEMHWRHHLRQKKEINSIE
jgi:hypothetical protein